MSRLPAALLVAGAAALLDPAGARAQTAVALRYQPPVGQVTHYRAVSQTWIRLPGMPAADTTKPTMTRTMYSTSTVTGLDGGARVVKSVIDSSSQDLGPMGALMPGGDPFKGITITQHVDPLGRVLASDVTGPPDANPMVLVRMRQDGSQRPVVLPERRVSPGDTWTWADTLDMNGGEGAGSPKAVVDVTYRLVRVRRTRGTRLATIALRGVMHGAGATAATGAGPRGTMSGEIVLDLGAGRVVRATTRLTAYLPGEAPPMRTVSTTEMLP